MGQRKMPHTVTARGKRVAVVLRDGSVVTGKFVRRADNNRWIEINTSNFGIGGLRRLMKSDIVSFSPIKGNISFKRLGIRDASS
jgi:hypothetical protein